MTNLENNEDQTPSFPVYDPPTELTTSSGEIHTYTLWAAPGHESALEHVDYFVHPRFKAAFEEMKTITAEDLQKRGYGNVVQFVLHAYLNLVCSLPTDASVEIMESWVENEFWGVKPAAAGELAKQWKEKGLI